MNNNQIHEKALRDVFSTPTYITIGTKEYVARFLRRLITGVAIQCTLRASRDRIRPLRCDWAPSLAPASSADVGPVHILVFDMEMKSRLFHGTTCAPDAANLSNSETKNVRRIDLMFTRPLFHRHDDRARRVSLRCEASVYSCCANPMTCNPLFAALCVHSH